MTNNDPDTSNPFGKLIYPVNDDAVAAVVANDDDIALLAQLLVPVNEPMNDPVNDPVLTANVMDVAADAEVTVPTTFVAATYDAVVANDAVLGVNVIDVAADAVVANEEETTLLAQLLVPNNDPLWIPTNDPVNDPVNGKVSELNCNELLTNPAGIPVSDDQSVEPIACVGAHEAETAKDAVVANDELVIGLVEIIFVVYMVLTRVPVSPISIVLLLFGTKLRLVSIYHATLLFTINDIKSAPTVPNLNSPEPYRRNPAPSVKFNCGLLNVLLMVTSPFLTVVAPTNVVDPDTPNDPVLLKLPDIIALPVNGNVGVDVAFNA